VVKAAKVGSVAQAVKEKAASVVHRAKKVALAVHVQNWKAKPPRKTQLNL
jgi:hypothetical protein